jgi:hypothetical protein
MLLFTYSSSGGRTSTDLFANNGAARLSPEYDHEVQQLSFWNHMTERLEPVFISSHSPQFQV